MNRIPRRQDPDRLVANSTTDTQTTQPGFIYADTFTAFLAQQRSFVTPFMYSGDFFPRIEARGAAVDAGVEGGTRFDRRWKASVVSRI